MKKGKKRSKQKLIHLRNITIKFSITLQTYGMEKVHENCKTQHQVNRYNKN